MQWESVYLESQRFLKELFLNIQNIFIMKLSTKKAPVKKVAFTVLTEKALHQVKGGALVVVEIVF